MTAKILCLLFAETTNYRVVLFRNYANVSKLRQSPLLKRQYIVSSCFKITSMLRNDGKARCWNDEILCLRVSRNCGKILCQVSCFEKLWQNLVSNFLKYLCLLCLLLLEWRNIVSLVSRNCGKISCLLFAEITSKNWSCFSQSSLVSKLRRKIWSYFSISKLRHLARFSNDILNLIKNQ